MHTKRALLWDVSAKRPIVMKTLRRNVDKEK